jgi:hypothetical protein
MVWRARDQALRVAWSRRQVRREDIPATLPPSSSTRRFTAVLPPDAAERVPEHARAAVLTAADLLMKGEWEVLGVIRTDLVAPDWFCDPVTGRRSSPDRYAFQINHRSEEQTGNVKQVWEISRLQHLTLLATAWFVTGDKAYACRVADQLRSWWRENPFLSGIHWTSGIELGVRLISLVWIRLSSPIGLAPADCSRIMNWRYSRSAGISSIWPRSGAGDRRPTITSSPRRRGSSWPAAPFRGSRKANAGGGIRRVSSSVNCSGTLSRRVSAGSWLRTTSASSPN